MRALGFLLISSFFHCAQFLLLLLPKGASAHHRTLSCSCSAKRMTWYYSAKPRNDGARKRQPDCTAEGLDLLVIRPVHSSSMKQTQYGKIRRPIFQARITMLHPKFA
jgi:hypothetical protein